MWREKLDRCEDLSRLVKQPWAFFTDDILRLLDTKTNPVVVIKTLSTSIIFLGWKDEAQGRFSLRAPTSNATRLALDN